MLLNEKIALVTGGGSGIGAAVCTRFSFEGATVVVVDRDHEAAQKHAATLRNATAQCVDIASADQVDGAVRAVVDQYGRLDVVANVAGIDDRDTKKTIGEQLAAGAPLDITSTLTDEQWRRMMSVNLDGVFHFVRAALRVMLPQGAGSIINVASLAGLSGQAGMPHYSAAKAGVLALTKSVAKEVADRGVRVNAIAPGAIRTPMFGRSPAGVAGSIPMKRFGEPEEIASIAAFLASDDSSYVTGETINGNGGMLTV